MHGKTKTLNRVPREDLDPPGHSNLSIKTNDVHSITTKHRKVELQLFEYSLIRNKCGTH